MTGRRVISSTAAEIQPQSVEWAWQGLVPLGMLSITAGAPGWGKTQLMIGMCAKATRGQLPGALHGSPANVAYISAEDSLEHTLAPRFRAVGADLERVHLFRHVATNGRNGDEETPHIRIPDDVPLVTDWLTELDARILVCDPVVALIPTNLNTHRDQDTRRALAPLMHIAERHSIAVCLVMHLNKTIEADALNRLSGSVGFGGAARSVLLFAPDPDDPEGEMQRRAAPTIARLHRRAARHRQRHRPDRDKRRRPPGLRRRERQRPHKRPDKRERRDRPHRSQGLPARRTSQRTAAIHRHPETSRGRRHLDRHPQARQIAARHPSRQGRRRLDLATRPHQGDHPVYSPP